MKTTINSINTARISLDNLIHEYNTWEADEGRTYREPPYMTVYQGNSGNFQLCLNGIEIFYGSLSGAYSVVRALFAGMNQLFTD